jgi:hypothetical protein
LADVCDDQIEVANVITPTPPPSEQDFDRSEMIDRAFKAWHRRGPNMDQPAEGYSDIEYHDEKPYVVLRNGMGVLHVYRITAGRLRSVPYSNTHGILE